MHRACLHLRRSWIDNGLALLASPIDHRSTGDVDEVPPGEVPPPWVDEMIDRSLAAPPTRPADEDVVRVVAADLVATLGFTREQADRLARREAVNEFGGGAFEVAEELQEWLQEVFRETSWPACPDHRRHPLWLNPDPPTGVPIERLTIT